MKPLAEKIAAGGGEATGVLHALENLSGAVGRLELVSRTRTGAPVFVDYSHTPDALATALKALRPYVKGRLRVLFGAGGDRDPGKRALMGEAAHEFADMVYVTDDNPRTEDPAAIRAAVMAGCPDAIEIAGRSQAIARAVADAEAGDVVLVAGKGHEDYQVIGTEKVHFSDHEEVRAAIAGDGAA